jgi:hypothetical protein
MYYNLEVVNSIELHLIKTGGHACDVQWRALVQFQEGNWRIYCMNLFLYCIILTAVFVSHTHTVKRDRNHMDNVSNGA